MYPWMMFPVLQREAAPYISFEFAGLTVSQAKTVTWSYPSLNYDTDFITGRY
jgi:hypothetical protein